MSKKYSNPAQEIARFAAFGIAWAAIALVAFYLPLQPEALQTNANSIAAGKLFCQNATPLAIPGIPLCARHVAFPTGVAGTNLILFPIPLAAIALIALGIAARIRKAGTPLMIMFATIAILGAISSALVFVSTLGQKDAERSFIVAAEVIVLSAVIGRLQRPIRQAFTTRPALSSLGTVLVVYASFVLAQSVTFTQIILEEANVWILTIAFGLLVFSGIQLSRRARRVGR